MKVTDKQYYLDDSLVSNIDIMIKRQAKSWDNLILMDGDEGAGKSTFAKQIGYYIANKTGKSFSCDNIFFEFENMGKFASENDKQVIIWDEAAMSAMASDWSHNDQKNLIKILMMARKKGHFWIFLIPKFATLKEYLVLDRAICLIHVYTPDLISRGNFSFYGKRKMAQVYHTIKKTKSRNYSKKSFAGKFIKGPELVDEELYEKKKDKAISSLFNDKEKENPFRKRFEELRYKLSQVKFPVKTKKEFMGQLGYDRKTLYNWSRFADSLGISEEKVDLGTPFSLIRAREGVFGELDREK